jgi:hypothetical protein
MTCLHCLPGSTRSTGRCTCPLVCTCLIALAQPSGQCATCLRRIASLMSIDHYRAAIAAYPELVDQTVKAMA